MNWKRTSPRSYAKTQHNLTFYHISTHPQPWYGQTASRIPRRFRINPKDPSGCSKSPKLWCADGPNENRAKMQWKRRTNISHTPSPLLCFIEKMYWRFCRTTSHKVHKTFLRRTRLRTTCRATSHNVFPCAQDTRHLYAKRRRKNEKPCKVLVWDRIPWAQTNLTAQKPGRRHVFAPVQVPL